MLVPSRDDLLKFHTKIIVKLHHLYLLNLVHDVVAAVAKAPVCQNSNFWGPWVRILAGPKIFSFFHEKKISTIFFFLFLLELSYLNLKGCSQTMWTY